MRISGAMYSSVPTNEFAWDGQCVVFIVVMEPKNDFFRWRRGGLGVKCFDRSKSVNITCPVECNKISSKNN